MYIMFCKFIVALVTSNQRQVIPILKFHISVLYSFKFAPRRTFLMAFIIHSSKNLVILFEITFCVDEHHKRGIESRPKL